MPIPEGFILDKQPKVKPLVPEGFVLDNATLDTIPSHTPGSVKLEQPDDNPYANDEPTFSNDLPGAIKSVADSAAVAGSAIVSPVVSAIAGYAGIFREGNGDLNSRAETIRKTQEALTYQPRTEEGAGIQKTIAYPFEKLAEGGAYLGEKTATATGSPLAGASVDTAVNMIPFAIPFLKKGYTAGKAAIIESDWYRKATIPERDLVIQTIDETAAGLKAQGWSAGQVDAKLARLDPAYFQEQLAKRAAAEGSAKPAPAETVAPEAAKPVTDTAVITQAESAPSALPEYTPRVNQPINIPQGFVLDTPQQSEVISNGNTEGQTSAEEGNGRQENGLLSTSEVSATLNKEAEPASGSSAITGASGISRDVTPNANIAVGEQSSSPVLPDAQISSVTPSEAKPIQVPAPESVISHDPVYTSPEDTTPSASFERLTPAGRRGAVAAYTVNISPSQSASLNEIRQEVSDGEAGKRVGIYNENSSGSTNIAWGSTFPEYFKNKGLTKNQVLPILDRIIKGEPVTEAQWLIAEDMLKAKRYDMLNRVYEQRAAKRAESESIAHMSEADRAAAVKAADDFFSQFGGNDEITSETVGSVGEHDTGTAGRSGEAPISETPTGTARTVKIDESGWGQQVAPELQGDKKIIQFGDKKPTGRNVGLSEFMDGFDDPQKDLFSKSSSGSHADTGGYNLNPPGAQNAPFGKQKVSALQLPEIVEIAKTLMNGKYPHILRKLNKRGALGVFKTGKGSIDLLAEIAGTPGLLERVLAHEVGHLVDWLPDHDIKRGNILGRIASLKKYMGSLLAEYEGAPGVLNSKDRARLRREAERELKANERPEETIIETITREVPKFKYSGITPEMITDLLGLDARDKYPKLYRAFQEMNTAEKKAVLVQAMKGLVHDSVSHFGERIQTGTETVTEQVKRTVPGVSATPEQISKRYAELVQAEIDKRNLYKREVISDELKNLTMHWKPFSPGKDPGYTKYRFSSVELYADAFSALINDPAIVRKIAPTFEKAFMSYLDRKPEVSAAYYDIQQRLNNDAEVMEHRQENVREMFSKGEEVKKASERRPLAGILHSLYKDLIDKNADINLRVKNAKKLGRNVEDADNPAYWVETLPYVSGEVYSHLHEVDANVILPIQKAGLTEDDLGEYMMLKRITGDRAELANPLGHTAETAAAGLKHLEQQLGPEKWNALTNAVDEYKAIREKNVIDVVDKADMWPSDFMKHVRDNTDYATWEVTKFIEAKYGRGVSAQIYKQVGTLQEIRNPFIATVMKDAALIRAANIKIVKQKTTDFLKEHFPSEIRSADTRWNGKTNAPIEPTNPEEGMIMFPHKGEIQALYVPKGIAETFDRSPYEASAILKAWQMMNIPLRAILVNHNPLWMVANVPRDFMGTWKNTPGLSFFTLLKYYGKAAPEAWQDVFNGKMSPEIQSMFKNKMLVTDRQYTSIDESPDTELDRMLQQFGKSPVQYRNKVIKPFVQLWDTLGNAGKFTERIGKVAGHKYLTERTDTSPEKIAHNVRSRVGTPDVHRGGRLHTLYNNIFLFSNVAKEGWRSSWESAGESKAEYAWKTAAYNVIPKLLMKMATLGAMGVGVKKIMDSASNYDKTNYHVVPLGMDENGKGVYLRIPQDFTGGMIGGVLWNAMSGKVSGSKSVLSYVSEQSPYGLNPYLSAGSDIVQIMRGLNPYDDYRGRTVIPDQVFKANDYRKNVEFAKHLSNSLGGGMIYKFSGNGPDRVQSELEKALKYPGANVLGRFLKVSDQGEREQLKEVKEDVGEREARRSLDVKELIVKDINAHAGKPTVSDKVKLYRQLLDSKMIDLDTKFSEFRPRYERYSDKTDSNAKIDAVIDSQSIKEKSALLQHYQQALPEEQYQKIRNQLLIEGHIKASVFKEIELEKAGVK